MTITAISQSNYLPWIGYFHLINKADNFVLFDTVQYTRRSWRNRNKIIKNDGSASWLTVPVKTKNKYTASVREMHVADQNWRRKHFLTIKTNYAKTPYYHLYESTFEDLLLNTETTNLSEINHQFIAEICRILGIQTNIYHSEEYCSNLSATEKLISECKRFETTTYLSGPSAKSYLELKKFHDNNIKVEWMSYPNYPIYAQKTEKFDQHVSVIDLICHLGPTAKNALAAK